MEKISIFNYEIFYLDYLEGKLNREEIAMLMVFLEEHPECRLPDEELPVLNPSEMSAGSTLKKKLYQTDDNDLVGIMNYEHFLIAKKEGLLDAAKREELDRFIAENELTHEERLLDLTLLQPDPDQHYAFKKELRQPVRVILWPYVSAAASVAAVFLLFLTIWNAGDGSGTGERMLAGLIETSPAPQVVDNGDTDEGGILPVISALTDLNPTVAVLKKENPEQVKPEGDRKKLDATASERLPSRRLIGTVDEKKLQPLSVQLNKEATREKPEKAVQSDVAYSSFADLDNPIEPITKVLSNKTNRDIDFRSGQSKVNESRGFYLKVGKFEVSRRKH